MRDEIKEKPKGLTYGSEELKIIHTYRYFSWFLTSLFYFFGESTSHWIFKLGVIAMIYISARITIGGYYKFDNNIKFERSIILAETIGIILILLPTGGLNSPFIWYALNPVLISASYLSYYFCWFCLICYLSASTIVSYLFFNPRNQSFLAIISEYSHLILIFILITLAAQILTKLNNKLRNQSNKLLEANRQLNQANYRIQESMDYIMSLYQTVEAFTSQDNKRSMYQTFADYTASLTRAEGAFFWFKSSEIEIGTFFSNGSITHVMEDKLICKIKNIWDESLALSETIKINVEDSYFNAVAVQSASQNYGLIGYKADDSESDIIRDEHVNQLEFISELSAIILERFHLEEVTERLMIVEEQNRIANEMHDSVAQRLFSVSCAIHTLMENWRGMSDAQLQERLYTLQDSTHTAMKELRATIYRLSSRKGGEKGFQSDIKEYLDNVSKLNNITIKLEIIGDEELINVSKKRGLYRIICEATGNAIRHGKCSVIMINLHITNTLIELKILDNGEGFILNNIRDRKETGLGLYNMNRIVDFLDGKIDIDSKLGSGTVINIVIPNIIKSEDKKGA